MPLTDGDFVTSVDSTVELLALRIFGIEFDVVDEDTIATVRGNQAVQIRKLRPVSATSLHFIDAFGMEVNHDAALGHASI